MCLQTGAKVTASYFETRLHQLADRKRNDLKAKGNAKFKSEKNDRQWETLEYLFFLWLNERKL